CYSFYGVTRRLSGLGGIEAREWESEHTIPDFEAHSYSTQRKIGGIWAALPLPQPIHPKSDSLLDLIPGKSSINDAFVLR
ncbi:MAG: hypothetical protein PF589_08025, partial [Gammaproteobacteria bacterium]|nr:hypothetical protein [Gammaproteobacteria bacterium]